MSQNQEASWLVIDGYEDEPAAFGGHHMWDSISDIFVESQSEGIFNMNIAQQIPID